MQTCGSLILCLSPLLFVLSHFPILVYFIIIPQKPACFLMKDRKGMDSNERGYRNLLEREQGGETAITIYYKRGKCVFLIKEE